MLIHCRVNPKYHMKTFHTKQHLLDTIITEDDVVLDVGFWGQGVCIDDAQWAHRLLVRKAAIVDGVDLEYEPVALHKLNPRGMYITSSAEDFVLQRKYTKIVAADLIEHLPNPGLFLTRCHDHIMQDGRLIITTPNAFNLYVLAGKLMHREPPVNNDHTCYFNSRTLTKLLDKCGWEVEEEAYVYTLGVLHRESKKKKLLNILYKLCGFFTSKYMETLVVVAKTKHNTGSKYDRNT